MLSDDFERDLSDSIYDYFENNILDTQEIKDEYDALVPDFIDTQAEADQAAEDKIAEVKDQWREMADMIAAVSPAIISFLEDHLKTKLTGELVAALGSSVVFAGDGGAALKTNVAATLSQSVTSSDVKFE